MHGGKSWIGFATCKARGKKDRERKCACPRMNFRSDTAKNRLSGESWGSSDFFDIRRRSEFPVRHKKMAFKKRWRAPEKAFDADTTTGLPAYSDSVGTAEKCHCKGGASDCVAVSRHFYFMNVQLGDQKSVTISGETCAESLLRSVTFRSSHLNNLKWTTKSRLILSTQ